MTYHNSYWLFVDSKDEFFAVSAEFKRGAVVGAHDVDNHSRLFCEAVFTRAEIEALGFPYHEVPSWDDWDS